MNTRGLRSLAIALAACLVVVASIAVSACSKKTDTAQTTPAPTPAKKGHGSGDGSGGGKGRAKSAQDGGGSGPESGNDERRGAKMAAKMDRSRFQLGVVLPDGKSVELSAKQIWDLRGEPIEFGRKKWHGAKLVDVIKAAGATEYKTVEFYRKKADFSLTREEIEADPGRYYLIFSKTTDVKLADAKGNHPGIRKATHLKKLVLK